METNNILEKQCAAYIKSALSDDRLMRGLLKKYQSFNQVKGSYVLKNATQEEAYFLRGLLKIDYSDVIDISVSLKKFEAAFEKTCFKGVSLRGILEHFFNEKILSHKEIAQKTLEDIYNFFDRVCRECQHIGVKIWLEGVVSKPKSGAYQWILAKKAMDEKAIVSLLLQLDQLMLLLEKQSRPMVRQVAAVKITKNAHSLDAKEALYQLLMYYLSDKKDIFFPKTSEESRRLLLLGNIVDDDLHNTVVSYGLEAYSDNEKLGWTSFYERCEPLVLAMANLRGVKKLFLCGQGDILYCFENPAIFHTFVSAYPKKACMCTSGQINQCGYNLLALLEDSGLKVFYHGDFDPEGLLIADKLNQRFSNVILYGYEVYLYQKCLSDESISDRRLKQLDRLVSKELRVLAGCMKVEKKVAFEESMIEYLMNE